MNLMELIQPTAGLMINNQVHFRIDNVKPHPDWLKISTTDTTKLVGLVPDYSAGKTVAMTLFASTNTGGDSVPLLVHIPIGYDPEQTPQIIPFALSQLAGEELNVDVSKYIKNPGGKSVHLYVDKIEPLAPWLSHSQNKLTGLVPPEATGQLYQLTLRASTAAGGSSEPVTIPLQIETNKALKPRFIREDFALPQAVPGQSYHYDFMEHHEVTPEDIPYIIELAEGYPNPGWVNVINNQLIIDVVPDLYFDRLTLFLRIKNVPGGESDIAELKLIVLSSKIFPASGQDNDSNIHW